MYFSQRDARWADVKLGTGRSTIGAEGCLLCCVASVLCAFGVDTDPGRLNRWLARHGGFVGGNRLVFAGIEGLGARLVEVVDCWRAPAPMDLVAERLERGMGVAALVDMKPGGSVQQHWVRILAREEEPGLDWLIMDPWLEAGREVYFLLARYADHTWPDAERSVFRLAFYERMLKPGQEVPAMGAVAQVATSKRRGGIWRVLELLRG